MALRRDSGNRVLRVAQSTPAPAGQYLIAHACFKCRKSFKVAPRPQREAACPNCRGPIFEMGRSFRAPARRNVAQWAKIEVLYQAGFRFFSYRSFDCPPLPAKLSQVKAFIRNNSAHPMRVAEPIDSCK